MKKWIALCGAVLALGLLADLETFEGITATARAYYAWTDSLTDAPDDGKAFFGRDAMANYCIIGSRQLGAEVFGDGTLVPDKDVFRRLWDNYYVPYINGWFTASGRFRPPNRCPHHTCQTEALLKGPPFFSAYGAFWKVLQLASTRQIGYNPVTTCNRKVCQR